MPTKNATPQTTLNSSSPYLRANFAPVKAENVETQLLVDGEIPAELQGRFLRIGPNPVAEPNPRSYHWFMGTGMVHGLRISNGKAEWYRNNYVMTSEVASALKRPALKAPRKTRGGGVNTNVLCIAGEIFAIVEAGDLPVRLDQNLSSVEHSDFGGTLKHGFTAHPRKDPGTGELHAIAYEPGNSKLDYLVIDKSGHAKTVARVHAPHQPMIHDTAITSNFIVLLDLPVTFNVLTAITGSFPYVWNRKHHARIGLLPRSGDKTKLEWFDTPQCFVYHIMNAFEIGDDVVVDVVKNSISFDADIFKRDNESPCLTRWTLNRKTGKLSELQLSDQPVEFPRLNDAFIGREYRYGYTATFIADMTFGAACKHDLLKGTTLNHDFGKGRASMEPVFIARQNATEEDEGWVMSYVYDENTDKTDVVILDAQNFDGPAVAVIHLPVRVPYGFHGNWVADSELTATS